ncbi:MAG: heparinase II/III family protein [Maritimibacter sp.]
MNRWTARRAARAQTPTRFVSQPEPRTIGSFARGKQLVAGNLLFAGHLVEEANVSPWDVPAPAEGFAEALNGFAWMDDLAALGDGAARDKAQDWTWGWIARYGAGQGVGWSPDLTGRRLIRWINHAFFLLSGQESEDSQAFFRSLGHQTIFLSKRWRVASPGLPRFEALSGLIYAGMSLVGMEAHVLAALKGLERECATQIDDQGGLPTRNPEDLLEVFTLLNWAALALREAGREVLPEHAAAIERIAPTLRALRHADGGLARFHGGGRGLEGRLDQALATSGVRAGAPDGRAMGYSRLSGGRTSLVIDASLPPSGAASTNAHASTLAFELTSGRRPLVVNCGSGVQFGFDWGKAGRATPSHSVLSLRGVSSSRLGNMVHTSAGPRAVLTDGPTEVDYRRPDVDNASVFVGGHDGYVRGFGLAYMRRLEMTIDGRSLMGEETLAAVSEAEKITFDHARARDGAKGLPFDIRFHLHPDVDATLDLGGHAISMALKSGEIWVFRHDSSAKLSLEASVYLEKGRLKPRASRQIVLTGEVDDYARKLRWSLAKAKDTPIGVRDLVNDDETLGLSEPDA